MQQQRCAYGHELSPQGHFTVFAPNGDWQVFCDTDCLRQWFEEDWQRFVDQEQALWRRLGPELQREQDGRPPDVGTKL